MTYALGIDLGTTFSSAAVHRDGRTEVVTLGTRATAAPSVVLLRDDDVLAGEAAQRRAVTEPQRVAREFKRRIGDPTPVLLESVAYSAEALTARLLGWIVEQVHRREGGPPAAITVSHPANWGPYKVDLLRQAIRLADLEDVELVTEPEAAAVHYASLERVEPGSIVAVYDLGGGTFDAAVLCKTDGDGPDRFEVLGRPEGIERLGGIDFDAAVLAHVTRSLGGSVEALDPEDPVTLQALSRLRQDCVEAKEALSSDVDCSIPVMLPNLQTEVRLTRSELEAMIRPALMDSLGALRRALRSAAIEPEDVSAVLLVGGSSRIPLVAQLVANELGRPVAIDADPTNSVALGAALLAARQLDGADAARGGADDRSLVPLGAADPVDEPAGTAAAAAVAALPSSGEPTPDAVGADAAQRPSQGRGSRPSRLPLLAGVGVALVLALVAGYVIVRGSGGDPDPALAAAAEDGEGSGDDGAGDDPTADGVDGDVTGDGRTDGPTSEPADEEEVPGPVPTPCPTGPAATACLVDIVVEADGGLTATYVTRGYTPELEPVSDHIHFYFDTVVGDDERNAGTAGSGGDWRLWDGPNPFSAAGGEQGRTGYTLADADAVGARHLCALVARPDHSVVPGTGNCIAIPRP